MNTQQLLRERIKELRKKGFTIENIAKLTDLSITEICKILRSIHED